MRALEGHTEAVHSISLTPDGRWLLSGSTDGTLGLWELDWEYEVPAPADWDKGARPYLAAFLVRHCPTAADGLTPTGRPSWSETDLPALLHELQQHGFGWLRPEGVRRQLGRMAAEW